MDYKELDVWIESRKLVKNIYNITKTFPDVERYGLVSQIRRSAISIPSNIAEGCGRRSYKDSLKFYSIARGSLFELETQIYLSKYFEFLNASKADEILEMITKCKKILNGFINYHNSLIES